MYKIFAVVLLVIVSFAGCSKKADVKKPKYEYGKFYTDGSPSKKWVAITFDDGPNPEPLGKILETLKEENVKATFFVVGSNMKQHSQWAKKYIQYGHEIGNHTYSHRNYYQLKEKKSMQEIEKILSKELDDGEAEIIRTAGVKPLFMRMPNGFNSPMVKKVAKEKEYLIVNWTFGCDWQKYSKDELIKKYLRSVEPGAIFLFHEKNITAEALSEIITGIEKKGYEIVPLREILGIE